MDEDTPIANYAGYTKVRPGHEDAVADILAAIDTGIINVSELSNLTESTPDGLAVTEDGKAWLSGTSTDGLAHRLTYLIGQKVVCPDWCLEDHPRMQLAARPVVHTAFEQSGPWGTVIITRIDLPNDPDGPLGPTLDLQLDDESLTSADARGLSIVLAAAAEIFARITAQD